MKVLFMKQKYLDQLQNDIPNNVNRYEAKDAWVDQYFIDKETPNYYFESGIEVEDYQLIQGGPESDFENAKIIYEAFSGKINAVQASDLRLWAYLAHVQHWDYMRNRWAIDIADAEDEDSDDSKKSPEEKAIDRIGSRYFFKASKGKAFVRQGIARLYWSAYLTYDEANENGNPYEMTEFFFSKQDIFTSITERSYARNKVLILAALKELKRNPDLIREDIRLFLAKLNQAGAITVLDSLNSIQASELCKTIMDEVKQVPILKEGSKFKAIEEKTGRKFVTSLYIKDGHVESVGKVIITSPKNLIGKKEGSKITIAGKKYIIRDIK